MFLKIAILWSITFPKKDQLEQVKQIYILNSLKQASLAFLEFFPPQLLTFNVINVKLFPYSLNFHIRNEKTS